MHYSVAVVTNGLNENELINLLAPYDENRAVEPYVEMTKEEIIATAKWYKEDARKRLERNPNGESWGMKFLTCETDKEFYQKYIQDYKDECIDENGNTLTTYNPNSKWDWWSYGGRFESRFILKDGSEAVGVVRIGDIDWDKMKDTQIDWARNWDLYMGAEPITEDEKEFIKFNIYNKQYYLDKYETKERYIAIHECWSTYAMCNSEGWFEQGKMGWFTDKSDTKMADQYIKYIKNYLSDPKNQDKYITVIDCHI